MTRLIEPLERRQLFAGVAAPAVFAPPDSALLQISEVELLPTPAPQPRYDEVKRYTGVVRHGRRQATPVEVVQLYPLEAGAPAGTRLRFPGGPDGEFFTDVQLRNRRFVMKSTRVETGGDTGSLYRTVEFRGRLKRDGQLVTGTYRWTVSHIASYKALPPFLRGRAPFRLEAVPPPP